MQPAPREHRRPDRPIALAVLDGALVRIDVELNRPQVLAVFAAEWCEYDPGNQVIWALGKSADRLRLVVVSLDGHSEELAAFPPEAHAPNTMEVWRAAARILGGVHDPSSEPQLRLDLDARQFVALDNCSGDASWYCVPPADSEQAPPPDARSAGFKQQMVALAAGVVTAPARLDALRGKARGAHRGAIGPIPTPLPLTCHPGGDQGDCGSGFVLGPSPYWAVKTGEAQGDFFHQYYHLFDSRNGEYFLPDSPNDRSPKLSKMSDWELAEGVAVAISPDGMWMMEPGRIVNLDGLAPNIAIERDCGWLD